VVRDDRVASYARRRVREGEERADGASAHAREPASGEADRGLEVVTAGLLDLVACAGAHAAALFQMAPDEPMLAMTALTGVSREFLRPWFRISLSAPLPVADAVRRRELVYIVDEEELARRYPDTAIILPPRVTLCVLPLVTKTSVQGAVAMLISGPRPLPDDERERLLAVASAVAARLEAEEWAGRAVRSGRFPVSVAPPGHTGEGADVEAAVARLPEGLCSLDERGRVGMVSPAAARLLGRPARELVARPLWTTVPWLTDPMYEDHYRSAVLTRRPVSFTARRPPDRWLTFELYPDTTGTTVRITPVEPREESPAWPRAATGPRTPEKGRPDRAAPPRWAGGGEHEGPVVSARIGAIYHILQLASSLAQAASVRDVVDLVGDQIMPAFGGGGLTLLTADRHGRLSVAGVKGYTPDVVRLLERLPVSTCSPRLRSLLLDRPVFIESRQELERHCPPEEIPEEGMSSWAFLPLVASGRPVGTCVLAFAEPHRFTHEERAVLTSLVGLIAQALERARMFDSKQALARGLQAGLLPHALPHVPGLDATARYLPSTEGMDVGGDFYDLIRLDEDTAAAVIGDVQGHNVSAAALMGQVRTAVRAYATAGVTPCQVLANTNRLLIDLDPGLFASCVYLQLDLRRHKAHIARAGHPPPLLRCPGGRAETVDMPGGLLLGIDADAEYASAVLPMPPGSMLALYTDGLVETPENDIETGAAELAARLDRAAGASLEEAAESLVRPVRQAGRRGDDVALLVLRARGDVATMP